MTEKEIIGQLKKIKRDIIQSNIFRGMKPDDDLRVEALDKVIKKLEGKCLS